MTKVLHGGEVPVVDVLGVHGIGQQQGGRNQLLGEWVAALKDGIERARGRGGPAPSMDIAFYGDLFLDSAGRKGLPPTVASQEDLEALDADALAFLQQVEDEVVHPEETIDKGTAKFGRVSEPVNRLGAWLEQKYGVAEKFLFYGDLVQVRLFQRDRDLASRVLDRVREGLAGRPQVLIGHSLGSVVAYEALCRVPDHGVRTFITLGSPLGLRSIREALSAGARARIDRLPPGADRWVNIRDPHDPVTLDLKLSEHWPRVEDATVNNGKEAHAVVRYLGKQVTGEAVAGGLA